MNSNDKPPASGTGAGSSSSFSERKQGHHRRRSSVNVASTLSEQRNGNFLSIQPRRANEQSHQPSLSPIPGTPMTLSRSPSPVPGSAWSSPGLNSNHSGRSTPSQPAASPQPWEASKMRGLGISSYPSAPAQSQGFFKRHMRGLSSSLPRFAPTQHAAMIEKEEALNRRHRAKFGATLSSRLRRVWKRMGPRLRQRLLLGLLLWLLLHYFYSPLLLHYRRSSWGGGGKNYVMILPANKEGGVMDWKSSHAWAIERDSVSNKRRYVHRWGYDLEIADMKSKRKYAHEWRESWEKVDKIRDTFKKYPDVEWIWWLDLHTVIMEPYYSLQSHVFKNLADKVYRDINVFNPRNITHPFEDPYLDDEALSPVGDGKAESINLILSQDCAGFSLGSFFIRRSAWTERLLDVWWDPVAYEQKHREWQHQEQSALEDLYESQPWVRQHTAFLPQRMINSYPQPACGDGTGKNNTMFHYDERDRDFIVNMAGCEANYNCWWGMYFHRQYSYWLNRTWWEKFKEDLVAVGWFKLTGHHVKL